MTTNIVQSITDEQLADIEERARLVKMMARENAVIGANTLLGLISRLRAAEADVERKGKALSDIMAQVDLNIRPTVRDIINGMPDANDIYDYCERIDEIALAAMERDQ